MKFSLKHIFFFFSIISCVPNNITVEKTDITKKTLYTSTGFALIYNNNLYQEKLIGKKMDNSEYQILHLTLKPNTYVKISNPENQKSIIAKVKYKTFHPIIYNSVISKVIADDLENILSPLGCAVIVEGSHGCMTCRGVKKQNAIMTTSAMRGVFFDKSEARAELMQLIHGK